MMLHLARTSVQTTAGNLTCLLGKGLATIQYHTPGWHWAESCATHGSYCGCFHLGIHPPAVLCPQLSPAGACLISEPDAQHRAWGIGVRLGKRLRVPAAYPGRGWGG